MAINQGLSNVVLGPLVSANNLVGWNLVQVALVNTTAKVFTPGTSYAATPLGILAFTTSGSPSPMSGTPNPAITAGSTSITLTPTSTITVNLIIMWSIPSQMIAGLPTTNFV